MSPLTKRIEALESSHPLRGGFDCMLVEIVRPHDSGREVRFAKVYGRAMDRNESESAEAFVARVKAAAVASKPNDLAMPTATIAAHPL